jgi:hypothetical protein
MMKVRSSPFFVVPGSKKDLVRPGVDLRPREREDLRVDPPAGHVGGRDHRLEGLGQVRDDPADLVKLEEPALGRQGGAGGPRRRRRP